jgi:hypothetical protein
MLGAKGELNGASLLEMINIPYRFSEPITIPYN